MSNLSLQCPSIHVTLATKPYPEYAWKPYFTGTVTTTALIIVPDECTRSFTVTSNFSSTLGVCLKAKINPFGAKLATCNSPSPVLPRPANLDKNREYFTYEQYKTEFDKSFEDPDDWFWDFLNSCSFRTTQAYSFAEDVNYYFVLFMTAFTLISVLCNLRAIVMCCSKAEATLMPPVQYTFKYAKIRRQTLLGTYCAVIDFMVMYFCYKTFILNDLLTRSLMFVNGDYDKLTCLKMKNDSTTCFTII